jgi:hypothetical protein
MSTTYKKNVSDKLEYDVAVAGGGSAGIAGAVGAARTGARVCLVEKFGFLGGAATGGFVNYFQEGPQVGGKSVIRGIYENICDRLRQYDGIVGNRFDEEKLKMIAYDLCEQYSIDLLLHAFVFDVTRENNKIVKMNVATKQGPIDILAKTFVDTTGDGDLSAFAGASYETGRNQDSLTQPITLVFRLSNVDIEKFSAVNLEDYWSLFRSEYDMVTSRGKFISSVEPESGLVTFCTTHVAKVNATDFDGLTRAEVLSHKQAFNVYKFMKEHVPGCENAYLADTAPIIGVRETRRIVGEYMINRDDIFMGSKFEDVIGCSTSWIDMHRPDGEGVLHEYPIEGVWFEIPLRSLIVKSIANLLVAGRCMSATHEAQGSLRTIPTCILTGQGAGVAAGLAAINEIAVRDLPILELHKALDSQGVWLGR